MTHWTYSPALQQGVFPHEGGYTNDAADPGGPTNWGITIDDARAYWKPGATADDVRNMPKSVAEDIYAAHYAAPLRYDDLPTGVDYAVLDYGINSGIGRAARVLQQLVGVNADGVIGAETLAAMAKRDPAALVNAICDERLAFLQALSTWPVFGVGWGRRVAEVRVLALHFIDQAKQMPAGAGAADAPPVTPVKPGEMGKGALPAPAGAKTAVAVAAGGAAAGSAATWHAWLAAHPLAAVALVAGAVLLIGALVAAIERAQKARQLTPTLGVQPVPEKAAA